MGYQDERAEKEKKNPVFPLYFNFIYVQNSNSGLFIMVRCSNVHFLLETTAEQIITSQSPFSSQSGAFYHIKAGDSCFMRLLKGFASVTVGNVQLLSSYCDI